VQPPPLDAVAEPQRRIIGGHRGRNADDQPADRHATQELAKAAMIRQPAQMLGERFVGVGGLDELPGGLDSKEPFLASQDHFADAAFGDIDGQRRPRVGDEDQSEGEELVGATSRCRPMNGDNPMNMPTAAPRASSRGWVWGFIMRRSVPSTFRQPESTT
jgi:hypothetical protein